MKIEIIIVAKVVLLVHIATSYNNVEAVSSTVTVGGTGADWDKILPQNITINTGQNITWINSSEVEEPHTVIMMKDANLFPPLSAAFSIPNDTRITPTGPLSNVEPIIIPDTSNPSNQLIIMDNARAYNPVVIDASGTNVT